jgi:hypothetical protein
MVSVTHPTGSILGFIGRSSSIVLTRLDGPPFQTHYFSENLVAPGIELGPLHL